MAHIHNGNKISKWITIPCPCCNGKKKVINGQWLKSKREQAELDQRTFGSFLIPAVSGPYISDIERNRRECPPEVLDGYLSLVKE